MGKAHRKPRRTNEEAAAPAVDENADESVPDQTEAEVAALLCALQAAPGVWLTQHTLQRLVTDTSRYIDAYSRALHLIERRAVSLHMAPAPSRRAGPVHHLPDPARLDPWSCDPAQIEDASRVIATCPTCDGVETVACGRCRGSARVTCGYCRGSGRVQGARSMKNCAACRGKGDVACDGCSKGRVPCGPCSATGKVSAWLSISQTRISQVRVHPMGAAALVHKKLESPRDFDAGPEAWVNTMTSDTGTVEPMTDLPSELEPELRPVMDRALSTRVQEFSSVVHRFTYEATRMTGHVEVAGVPPAVSASSNWRPLRIRQGLAATTAVCLGLASFALVGSYGARHAWYETYGQGGLVGTIGTVIAIAAAVVVAGLLLPRRLWSRGRVWAPLGLAGVAALSLGVLWRVPGPSAAGAKKALAEKNLARAQVEADALRELKIDWTGGSEVLDDLHMERLKGITTFAQLAAVVAEPWNLEGRRKIAFQVFGDVVEQKRIELYGAKNLAGLVSLQQSVGELLPSARDNIGAFAMLLRADKCVPEKDCSCTANNLKAAAAVEATKAEVTRLHDQAVPAFAAAIKELVTSAAQSAPPAPARDPHERQAALRQALQLAKCYADLAGAPSDPAPSALEAQLLPVDREVEAADKKAAALAAVEEAKRKRAEAVEEAKRKQQEAIDEARRRQQEAIDEARRRQAAAVAAAQEAAEDNEASGGTMCADGSYSGSSGRGTCSHHGGVAGGGGRRHRRR